MNIIEEELQTRRRWRVRRRMAKTSFIAGIIIYPLLCIVEPKLIELATHFYTFVTANIVVYIGGATYDDTHRKSGGVV